MDPLLTGVGASRAYTGGSKTDWYLPNKAELILICQWNNGVIQSVEKSCAGGSLNSATYGAQSSGFAGADYGSSSFLGTDNVWTLRFDGGNPAMTASWVFDWQYRPVRAY
jgi:hypothetical protein